MVASKDIEHIAQRSSVGKKTNRLDQQGNSLLFRLIHDLAQTCDNSLGSGRYIPVCGIGRTQADIGNMQIDCNFKASTDLLQHRLLGIAVGGVTDGVDTGDLQLHLIKTAKRRRSDMGMECAVLGSKQLVVDIMQLNAAETEVACRTAEVLPGTVAPAFCGK